MKKDAIGRALSGTEFEKMDFEYSDGPSDVINLLVPESKKKEEKTVEQALSELSERAEVKQPSTRCGVKKKKKAKSAMRQLTLISEGTIDPGDIPEKVERLDVEVKPQKLVNELLGSVSFEGERVSKQDMDGEGGSLGDIPVQEFKKDAQVEFEDLVSKRPVLPKHKEPQKQIDVEVVEHNGVSSFLDKLPEEEAPLVSSLEVESGSSRDFEFEIEPAKAKKGLDVDMDGDLSVVFDGEFGQK